MDERGSSTVDSGRWRGVKGDQCGEMIMLLWDGDGRLGEGPRENERPVELDAKPARVVKFSRLICRSANTRGGEMLSAGTVQE